MPLPHSRRLFAVVPAAGLSRRMGQPKLLLPWGKSTVISQMLAFLRRPEIAEILVVVRPDDAALRAAVQESGATIAQPETPPPEMRDSVEYALHQIENRWNPLPDDGWLLIPADHPLLEPAILDQLLTVFCENPGKIIVPVHLGKRGHPTLFPWSLTSVIYRLPSDQGLNQLLPAHRDLIVSVNVDSEGVLIDLDTPADYAKLSQRQP